MRFRVKGVEYTLPTKIEEVPLYNYLKIAKGDDTRTVISKLAGLPDDVEIDDRSLVILASSLEYLQGFDFPETNLVHKDIALLPFGAFYYSNMALKSFDLCDAAPLMICYINSQLDWTNSVQRPAAHEANQEYYINAPAWKYYPLIVNYCEQMQDLVQVWNSAVTNKAHNPNPMKGTQRLAKFKERATLLSLADNDLQKYNYIYGQKFTDVILSLGYKTTLTDIQFLNTPKKKK